MPGSTATVAVTGEVATPELRVEFAAAPVWWRAVVSRAAPFAWFIAVAGVLAVFWELYKAAGEAFDDEVPVLGWGFPVATNDLSLPHVWLILGSLFEPTQRGDDEILLVTLGLEGLTTLKTAVIGFLGGSVAGFGLAMLVVRLRTLGRGLMPWVVASQTVPLVAIAPMIVVWGGRVGLPEWGAVAAIAVYLAFFPVTINALRGLDSATELELGLLRSWAASERQTMRYLRIPGSMPHLFSGLRLAATAALVGTLVGELSAGTGSGLGRAILNFSYFYSNGPEKLYASVLVAAAVGMIFVHSVALVERAATRHRPPVDSRGPE